MMQASVNEQTQTQVQERRVPVSSQLELELRSCWLEIDARIERLRCEEYRRMFMALAAGGHPNQLLPMPGPVPGPERELMPVPVGGSSSSMAQAEAIPVSPRVVPATAPACLEHHSEVSDPSAPSGSSGRGRGRGRGRGLDRGRGSRGPPGRAAAAASSIRLRLIDTEPPRNVLSNDDASHATGNPESTLVSSQSCHLSSSTQAGAQADPASAHNQQRTVGRFGSRAAVNLFLRENGLEPSSHLRPQDAALADATPDVSSPHFSALFGGYPQHERPRSRVRNILCLDRLVHPYVPSSPGESGVIFFIPGNILFEDDYPSFHIFLNLSPPKTRCKSRMYRYLGEYSKQAVTDTTVRAEEWLSLPSRCRNAWSSRIHSSKKPNIRAIHARVDIQNARPEGPPPSQGEIEDWLDRHPGRREGMVCGTLISAFNRGEEVRQLRPELFFLFLSPFLTLA